MVTDMRMSRVAASIAVVQQISGEVPQENVLEIAAHNNH